MYTSSTQIRVRYGETDKMGYLYYGNYAQYYEVGRTEWLRSLGTSYKELEDEHKIMLPVVGMQIRFLRPAYYDDLLTIKCTVKVKPTKHIQFHTEIYNEKNKLLNASKVMLNFVDMVTTKTVELPTFLQKKLDPYF